MCILSKVCFVVALFSLQLLYDEANKKLEESLFEVNRTIQTCLEDAESALYDVEYSQKLNVYLPCDYFRENVETNQSAVNDIKKHREIL